ncbi:MAG: TIGR00730 family Rossman fold protein [Deltaproteobacteria bacterium]|nr:TIGR00730 family Rossman fold protein [Deltaproteobacteria bacterium]MBK8695676.1 TIGR00730 family Rossman fold protein [Deltaproteobacteria bacterium]
MNLRGSSLAVYCGSSPGHDPVFLALATTLGAALALEGVTVVYGGASVGLMGGVADAALALGGRVVGVLPESLRARELAHDRLSELHITDDMHARKLMMATLADGFVALPGGYGTWEELLEVATWRQIGLHTKPVVVINHGGYYDPMRAQIDRAVEAGFMRPALRGFIHFAEGVSDAVEYLRGYVAPLDERAKFAKG